MSDINRAASVTPAYQGQNLWTIPGATASAYVEVPAAWHGAYLTFEADGADFYYSFSDSTSATVDETDVDTITSNAFVAATAPNACEKVKDGSRTPVDMMKIRVPGDAGKKLYLVFKASAAAGYLRVKRSSGYITP